MEDMIYNGNTFGSVADTLLANNFDPGVLRPWIDDNGKSYIMNNGKPMLCNAATLRRDEWKAIDDAVVEAAKPRLMGVQDLLSLGLTYNLDGLANTVLESETVSGFGDADMSINGETLGEKDRVEYGLKSIPLPITHKPFDINLRTLNMSRKLGRSLDVTQAALAGEKVGELIESVYFMGTNNFKYAGQQVYGLTNQPDRSTYVLPLAWNNPTITGALILADVQAMKQKLLDDGFYGPYYIYIPAAYETKLDDDYSAVKGEGTIRDRILKLQNVSEIKIADKLTGNNVVMVNMTAKTVRIINGMNLSTVQWDSKGGFLKHYKVMAIQVPQIRSDFDSKCGVCHGAV